MAWARRIHYAKRHNAENATEAEESADPSLGSAVLKSLVLRATLAQFAAVNDAAAATTKKLQKYAILADYFRGIEDDDDLRRAVRFAGGRTFASTDERVLAVGGAIVSDVVLRLLRVDPRLYHDTVVTSGEIGEALAKLWHRRPPLASSRKQEALALADLSQAFDDLASTGNV